MGFAGDMLAIIALLSMVGLAWRITRADIQHYKSQRCVEGIAEYLVDRTYKASSYIHIVPEERSSQCFHCHEAPFFLHIEMMVSVFMRLLHSSLGPLAQSP